MLTKKSTASGKVNTVQQADAPYMGFAASRLTVGETRCHASFKNGLHQRFRREPEEIIGPDNNHFKNCAKKNQNGQSTFKMREGLHVDQVVGGTLVEGVVEVENLVVQVLCKVHLLLWFMNQQDTFTRHRHHIYLLPVSLWEKQII